MSESPKAHDFFESSSAAVGDHELRRKLESASARHLDHFAQVKADFPPYDEERETAHRIKTDAIAHLDELLIDLSSKRRDARCSSPRTRGKRATISSRWRRPRARPTSSRASR